MGVATSSCAGVNIDLIVARAIVRYDFETVRQNVDQLFIKSSRHLGCAKKYVSFMSQHISQLGSYAPERNRMS